MFAAVNENARATEREKRRTRILLSNESHVAFVTVPVQFPGILVSELENGEFTDVQFLAVTSSADRKAPTTNFFAFCGIDQRRKLESSAN
jgi:hypothetical protein